MGHRPPAQIDRRHRRRHDLQESLADTYVYAGDGAKGLPILDRLLRIDPFHDQGVYPIYGRG